jgi:hypothetical protein
MMKLLLYAKRTNGDAKRLQCAIKGVTPLCQTEICRSVTSLSQRLRQRISDLTVIVLCAFEREELSEILALSDWLRDFRTILILPDRENDTIAQGLLLRPRFFSFADSDFSDVSAVLARMLRIYGETSNNCETPNSRAL